MIGLKRKSAKNILEVFFLLSKRNKTEKTIVEPLGSVAKNISISL